MPRSRCTSLCTPLSTPLFTFTALLFTVAALLFALAVPARSQDAAFSQAPEAFARDTHLLLRRLEKFGFSGVVLVARDGEVLFVEGVGLADRERGIPWSPATVSTVGSITKQLTGAAILLLAEEGKLAVTDPIHRFFDGVPEDKQGITVHHLLTHSSGIVDLDGYGDFDPLEREEFVRKILAQPLAFPPGEGYEYSNAGYSLLGAIIEQLTGTSYEDFLRRRLFLPHGMYETGYLMPRWGEGRLAQGYQGDEHWGTVTDRPMAADGPYWVLRANGGIHSTAYDMLRWCQALLDGRVLPPAALERLWAPHVEEGPGSGSFYGYGWVTLEAPGGLRVITHNGGNGIFFADLAIVPEKKVVIYLATGAAADLPLVEGLRERLGLRLLAGQDYPSVPEVAVVPAEELAHKAGLYALEGGGELEVAAGDGTLRVTPRDPQAFTALLSTRTPDPARAGRLSGRTEAFVRAMLAGDYQPLYEALGGEVPIERLREVWSERLSTLVAEHGPAAGFEVLGTALRGERDWTLVRFRFEHGTDERAFVFRGGEGERLLGISRRGLDPVVEFYPVEGGGYASFDPATADSRPLAVEGETDGSTRLRIGSGPEVFEARRRDGG